jgi:hypothetical protein
VNSKEIERIYAESSLNELKEYLLSSTLFWPLSLRDLNKEEQSSIPKLTPGNLYLCLRKINTYEFAPELMVGVKDIEERIILMLNDWQSSWKNKAQLEYPLRINMWESYLSELKRNPALNKGTFSYQVRNRMILDLLEEELKVAKKNEIENIKYLDESLKNLVRDGDFIWEFDLTRGFPKNPYWYLYIEF